MIIFETRKKALELRKKALKALNNSKEINKNFQLNPNQEHFREAKFLDKAPRIIKECNEYLKASSMAKIDKQFNIN
jgi:hypothetical protein